MKFYGQKGEDSYIYNMFFKDIKNKIFIELGAMDGIAYSNSKFFEDELGWTGILIEANPFLFEKLKINRPNCKTYNALISDLDTDLDFKYFNNLGVSCVEKTKPINHDRLYFNSKRPQFANQPQGSIKIKTVTLANIIENSGYNKIDFMSLDVEGHEYNVLKSIDFSKVEIYVILVEMLDDNNDNEKIINLLLKNNYIFHSEIGRNKVFILKNFSEKI